MERLVIIGSGPAAHTAAIYAARAKLNPLMFEGLLRNAAKVVGEERAQRWHAEGLLGPRAELTGRAALSHFATCYRQQIVFEAMQRLVMEYLALWYRV